MKVGHCAVRLLLPSTLVNSLERVNRYAVPEAPQDRGTHGIVTTRSSESTVLTNAQINPLVSRPLRIAAYVVCQCRCRYCACCALRLVTCSGPLRAGQGIPWAAGRIYPPRVLTNDPSVRWDSTNGRGTGNGASRLSRRVAARCALSRRVARYPRHAQHLGISTRTARGPIYHGFVSLTWSRPQ